MRTTRSANLQRQIDQHEDVDRGYGGLADHLDASDAEDRYWHDRDKDWSA